MGSWWKCYDYTWLHLITPDYTWLHLITVLQNVLKKQAADKVLSNGQAKEIMKGWLIKVGSRTRM